MISNKDYKLHNVFYTPDIMNPNNIIIADKKFKIVDKLDKTNIKNPNTLFTMLEPLLIRYNPDSYCDYFEELVEPRKDIFKKCLIASEKTYYHMKMI